MCLLFCFVNKATPTPNSLLKMCSKSKLIYLKIKGSVMKGPSVLNRTQQSAFWLRALSGWPANSCWATVPTVLRDPIPAPATGESVWLLDAPDYLMVPSQLERWEWWVWRGMEMGQGGSLSGGTIEWVGKRGCVGGWCVKSRLHFRHWGWSAVIACWNLKHYRFTQNSYRLYNK